MSPLLTKLYGLRVGMSEDDPAAPVLDHAIRTLEMIEAQKLEPVTLTNEQWRKVRERHPEQLEADRKGMTPRTTTLTRSPILTGSTAIS